MWEAGCDQSAILRQIDVQRKMNVWELWERTFFCLFSLMQHYNGCQHFITPFILKCVFIFPRTPFILECVLFSHEHLLTQWVFIFPWTPFLLSGYSFFMNTFYTQWVFIFPWTPFILSYTQWVFIFPWTPFILRGVFIFP